MKIVVYALVVAQLIMSGLIAYQFQSVQDIATTNRAILEQACENQHASVNILRLFLTEGSEQFELRPSTPASLKRLEEFTKTATILLEKADCHTTLLEERPLNG